MASYDRDLVDIELQAARSGVLKRTPAEYEETLKSYHKILDPALRAPIMQQYKAAYNEGAAIRGVPPIIEKDPGAIDKAAAAVRAQISQIPADRSDLPGVMNTIRKIFATKAAGPLGQRVNDINAIAKE